MTLTKEEIEKIVEDFNAIANRTDKKNSQMNSKFIIVAIAIVALLAGGGYYMYSKKGIKSPEVASPIVEQTPVATEIKNS